MDATVKDILDALGWHCIGWRHKDVDFTFEPPTMRCYAPSAVECQELWVRLNRKANLHYKSLIYKCVCPCHRGI